VSESSGIRTATLDVPRAAPLGRLLAAEVRWVLRRPRTLVMLGLFALIPVLIAIGVAVSDRRAGPGRGLIGAVAGNGLVLPVVAMTVALALLLPLAVAMAAADAIAGEAASGTLRGLLLAPVGRLRLVGMKAFGVLVVAVAAVLALAVVGVLAGLIVVGGAGGQLVTLSGTTLGFGEALGRVAIVAVWTVGQLAAVGAVALAVSAWTEHPLVVLAAVLGGLIVFGVLGAIPALDWLQPYLLTSGWSAGVDALRDPLPLAGMLDATGRALCYVVVGAAATVARMLRRDA
jgi:ABC-2 type transport system permease protein